MPEDRAAVLESNNVFGHLDRGPLERLASLMIERSLPRSEIVFHQGDTGESMFVVVEGLVKIFVTSEEGEEMVLALAGPSESFGELALLDGGPRSATARTLVPTRLLVLTRARLLELVKEHPDLMDSFLQALGELVRRLTQRASDLTFLDLPGRLAKLVLSLAEDRGRRVGDTLHLELQVTQSDLAAMVGGSRQSVNQILKGFEDEGEVEVQGRRIKIVRPEALRTRAGLF